jgi:hypothetical protein
MKDKILSISAYNLLCTHDSLIYPDALGDFFLAYSDRDFIPFLLLHLLYTKS